jgi:hypothetical protein
MNTSAKTKLPTLKQIEADRVKILAQARSSLPAIAKRLLPNGRVKGRYWQAHLVCKDEAPMNLSVDLVNGKWRDFHSAVNGADIHSLISYIAKLDGLEAQTALKQMLGGE